MLIIPPPIYRKRRGRAKRDVASPPLTLVAAYYNEALWIQLTFDRAIDIAAIDPSQITVDDGQVSGLLFVGFSPATPVSPATVEIPLQKIASASGPNTLLSAGAGNGIVAADDGETWPGVSDVVLPFP